MIMAGRVRPGRRARRRRSSSAARSSVPRNSCVNIGCMMSLLGRGWIVGVDFPQPEGPMTATTSPAATPVLICASAVGAPDWQVLVTPSSRPAPFGPRKPVTMPGGTTKSSPPAASVSPYRLLGFSDSIIACSRRRWRRSLRHATHARNHPPGPASAKRPQAEQATYAARPIRPPPNGLPGPARREAGQPPDRAERAEEHPGQPAGGPVRCGQRRTPARGGSGRFPDGSMVPVQPLHPVAAPVAPRRRVGRTPFRLGVHLLHPDEAVIHSFADGGSGTGARFSAQEIASTLTRRRSSAVLPWSGPPGLLSQFLSHSPPSGTVHQCSLGSCLGSSRTVADAGERGPALLESVLGATPQEFESRILRHVDLRKRRSWR